MLLDKERGKAAHKSLFGSQGFQQDGLTTLPIVSFPFQWNLFSLVIISPSFPPSSLPILPSCPECFPLPFSPSLTVAVETAQALESRQSIPLLFLMLVSGVTFSNFHDISSSISPRATNVCLEWILTMNCFSDFGGCESYLEIGEMQILENHTT